MTRDRSLVLLLAGLLTLAVATVLALWSFDGSGMWRGEEWDAWVALSQTERLELARISEQIQQRDDVRLVLAGARRFDALPVETQVRQRAIQVALAEVLAALSPPQRRSLLDLPAEGRAAQFLRIMQTRFPEKLQPLLGRTLGNN